jgi:hypothetical protein
VSFFEDAHPNNSGIVSAAITHRAGASPSRLSDLAAGREIEAGKLYDMKIYRNEYTGPACNAALQAINKKGG